MEVAMNRFRVLLGLAVTAALLVSLPAASASAQGNAPAEKTWSGQLVKVDTSTKLISVKGSDNKEMVFAFNDDTQVISPDKTVQGLTGKAGAQLKISYREERGNNIATKIELVEREQ